MAPTSQASIDVALGEHWLIAGMTGTGKTTGDRLLLSQFQALYQIPIAILDSKGDPRDFGMFPLIEQDAPPAAPKSGILVWRPGIDNQDAYNEWFGMLRRTPGPLLILIDEVSSVTASGKAPEELQRLMKQGRSLGKTLISNTQELAGVPKQIKSQATHIVRQRLIDQYDSLVANKLLRLPNHAPGPRGKFGLIYGRTDRPGVREFASWRQFLGA